MELNKIKNTRVCYYMGQTFRPLQRNSPVAKTLFFVIWSQKYKQRGEQFTNL